MSRTHIFSGVTIEVLNRMREQDSADHGLERDPDRIGGTVNKPTPFGHVVARFDHDNQRAEMTVTTLHKPMLLPAAVLWVGVSHALRRASGQAALPNAAETTADKD